MVEKPPGGEIVSSNPKPNLSPTPDEIVLPIGDYFRVLEVTRVGRELRILTTLRGSNLDEKTLFLSCKLCILVDGRVWKPGKGIG